MEVPFTGSHPAAVLPLLRPLRRLGVPPAALVVGSLAPDLPFFVTVTSLTALTHSTAGVGTIDLVIGAVAYAGWQLVGRPALGVLLPGRPAPVTGSPAGGRGAAWWRRALAVALGLVVGAGTHLIWDSFTHAGMWGVRRVPWLAESFGPLPGYEWAQYASSLAGLSVLAVRCAPGSSATWSRRTYRAWAFVIGAALTGAALGVWAGLGGEPDPIRGGLFLTATRGGLAGLLAVAMIGAKVALGGGTEKNVSACNLPAGSAPLTGDNGGGLPGGGGRQ
ncbi:DUF4184 family protein [Paractinoplanes ferrugineus]|uniref:DUF4184 family protein n=1 Tax=Paractinoplanes ferrugineus TaxID=113564 RepID=UPI001940B757|nr:DUF4184 family protein [Actinoplanes ferrugineus]